MDRAHFKEILHNRSLKATSSRLNLLAKLTEYESAMPYSAIQEAMAPIDRVTLYRTLESLNEQGIIHKAFQENNETYYAICGKRCAHNQHHHDHIHFKCVKCETVTCEKPNQKVNINLEDYEIHHISIDVQGICKSCKN